MTHATKAIYRWLLSDYVKVRLENVTIQNSFKIKTHNIH